MNNSCNNIKCILLINLMFIASKGGQSLSQIGFELKNLLRSSENDQYILKTTSENSYPIEQHTVTTSDGYILKVHRVPSSPKSSCKRKVPALIVHGLTGNAEWWFINGPGRSLAYVLSDAGYDAWFANARGSRYSRKHRTLDPNNYKFWEFSWHEIGMYDHPPVIDYILSKTNQTKLHYIGHSQGSTSFFVMTSLRPEYNAKIKTMHALSPVVFMKHTISPVFTLPALLLKPLEFLARKYGFSEILFNSWLLRIIGALLCPNQDSHLCFEIFGAIGGHNPKMEDKAIFPELFSLYPAGISIFQLLHYSQGIRNGGFQLYDFGERKNIKKYGQKRPPDYPLQNVNASSIFLYVSGNDYISNLTDVNRLIEKLPKKPFYVELEDKLFSHFDYVFGKYAKEVLYDKVIDAMKKSDEDSC